MRNVLSLILLISIIALASCGTGSDLKTASKSISQPAGMTKETSARGVADYSLATPALKEADTGKIELKNSPNDRKIIKNGEFTIESKNPTEDQRRIQSIAETFGGFVVTSEFQQSSNSSNITVNIIVRVPSANFQKTIEEIRKTGIQVIHEKFSGKDVTEEYVDLESRLRAKKALEAQFLDIMKQAHKVEDALSVQEKLSEVRTEIEQLEGRRRYYDNQSELSTINITLQTAAPLVAATQTGFWASIKNSVGDGVDVTVAIILGLIHFIIVFIPIFFLILLPLGLILRFLIKKNLFTTRQNKAEKTSEIS